MIHANSLDAYDSIIDSLPKSRARVMRVIVERKAVTRHEISEILGVPINCVTGRVRELLDDNLIIEGWSVKSVSGKPRALLSPKIAQGECRESTPV